MEIIIEEISRGHKLIGRHKFASNSVAIGRGYHNDIIISDPHVCAEHLSLNFDGANWIATDLDSVNGSFLDGDKKSAHGHIIRSGDVITLGKSQVRVVFPHHPVATSVTLSPFESLINLTRHPVVLTCSILLFAFIAGWTVFLNHPREITFSQLLEPAIKNVLIFSLWPGLIALVSHLTKHDARVLTQLGVCFIFYNINWLVDFFETLVHFNTSSNFVIAPLVMLIPIALTFCLFWLNCYIGFHMTAKRRAVVAASLTALLFGGSYLIQLNKKPEFSEKPRFNNVLMTPNFVLAPSSDVDTFVKRSSRLFEKSKKEITKDD